MEIYRFRKKDKMNKFKVGDKVKIREDLVVGKEYGCLTKFDDYDNR
jgi:hypothetical protein